MEKQIKMKVKIGDKIELFGQPITVTEELIKAIPDKFEVENELKFERGKVYRCYDSFNDHKVIFRFNCFNDDFVIDFSSIKKSFNTDFYGLVGFRCRVCNINDLSLATPEETALLEEADRKHGLKFNPVTMELEEIKPLFVTEDGVEIYEDDIYFGINDSNFLIFKVIAGGKHSIYFKRFSTEEAAAKWVEDNKFKSFDDYEKEFYSSIKANLDIDYDLLKETHPKQYYQIIGQYIADDLNGDWKPDNTSSISEYIVCYKSKTGFYIDGWYSPRRGHIRFATKEIGNKFLEIMGDKLNLLY